MKFFHTNLRNDSWKGVVEITPTFGHIKGMCIPSGDFSSQKGFLEGKAGIYIYIWIDGATGHIQKCYIGETENLAVRPLQKHGNITLDWHFLGVFFREHDVERYFDTDSRQYMEQALIDKFPYPKILLNGNGGHKSKKKVLTDEKQTVSDVLIDEIIAMAPALCFGLFVDFKDVGQPAPPPDDKDKEDPTGTLLYTTLRSSNAQGYIREDGVFVLMAGGNISPLEPTPTCPSSALNKLETEKDKLDGTKILENIEFKSSSGAACFVLKASANGNDVWKTADGVKLGDIGKTDIIIKKKKLVSGIGPLYCTGRGASAIGYLRQDGVFVLQAGSFITADEPTKACPSGTLKRLTIEAENLREDEVLADLEFGSASAAGNFVIKSSANGNEVWVTEDGIKLGELK